MKNIDQDQETSRPGQSLEPGDTADNAGRNRNRQRLRFRRATFAAANYIQIGIYTLYLYLTGQLAFDPIIVGSAYLVVVVVYSIFLWYIASGRNLHFRDPSLTSPQLALAAALTIVLFALGRTLFAQDLYFFAFMMSLLFAAFRLNLKQILATELPGFVALAAILLLHHNFIHETFGAAAERLAMYFASMVWVITFATIISRLRRVLSDRNKELSQALDQLNDVASRDDLTGAYNRRFVFQVLVREIERSNRSGEPLCVCLLDIDHFKSINDTHGHQVGDEILRELITRTQDSIREIDELRPLADYHVLSRFGGEEFLIALPLTDLEGGRTCAERVREAIRSQPFTSQAGAVQVSVSLGIAQYNSKHDTLESLIGRADAALYKAKANGRDQVVTAQVTSPSESIV